MKFELIRETSAARMISDAEICRRNGWGVGTVLESNEGTCSIRMRITAIGEDDILAKQLPDGRESNWMLRLRDWKKVQE